MAVSTKQFAGTYWRQLNGLLCIFKPTEITLGKLIANIKLIIPAGLNKMVVRPPRKILQYDTSLGVPLECIETDYSDHPLVIGPRYEPSDVRYYCASALGIHSSGVCVIGLNRGRHLAKDLEDSKPLRTYRLLGQLGVATDNLSNTGKVVERASFSRIHKTHIDKAVAAMQAAHQRSIYQHLGVHIQSQAAYELAVKGLIRPADESVPGVYGIRCVDFEKPYFTLEVTCVNETEDYLLNIVHTVGIRAHCVARCNSIRCIRYGPFTTDHALLRHSWKVENFVSNVELCNALNERDIKSGRRDNIQLTPLASNLDPQVDVASNLEHTVDESETLRSAPQMSRHQRRRRAVAVQSKDETIEP